MNKADMLALAERCEAAEGPTFVMDNEVADLMWWSSWGRKRPKDIRAPSYTASIDDAMELKPSGLVINMGDDTSFCWAHIWDDEPDYNGEPYEGRARTIPLALCAAALRARAENADDA